MKRTAMKRTSFKKKLKVKKKPKKRKLLKICKLRDKVWIAFSRFIRTQGSVNGFNRCVTCGEVIEVTKLHAGHFIHGKSQECYLDEDNVHPQCVQCNLYKSGNMIEYYPFMEKEYGLATIERLKSSPKTIWKRADLDEKLVYYKKKLEELTE